MVPVTVRGHRVLVQNTLRASRLEGAEAGEVQWFMEQCSEDLQPIDNDGKLPPFLRRMACGPSREPQGPRLPAGRMLSAQGPPRMVGARRLLEGWPGPFEEPATRCTSSGGRTLRARRFAVRRDGPADAGHGSCASLLTDADWVQHTDIAGMNLETTGDLVESFDFGFLRQIAALRKAFGEEWPPGQGRAGQQAGQRMVAARHRPCAGGQTRSAAIDAR